MSKDRKNNSQNPAEGLTAIRPNPNKVLVDTTPAQMNEIGAIINKIDPAREHLLILMPPPKNGMLDKRASWEREVNGIISATHPEIVTSFIKLETDEDFETIKRSNDSASAIEIAQIKKRLEENSKKADEQIKSLSEQNKRVEMILAQHKPIGHTVSEKIENLIDRYKSIADNVNTNAIEFQREFEVWLRAQAMVVEMTGKAVSEDEKNARLRGLLELIEDAVGKLKKHQFDLTLNDLNTVGFCKTEFPVRELMRKNEKLEARCKELEEKLNKIDPVTVE